MVVHVEGGVWLECPGSWSSRRMYPSLKSAKSPARKHAQPRKSIQLTLANRCDSHGVAIADVRRRDSCSLPAIRYLRSVARRAEACGSQTRRRRLGWLVNEPNAIGPEGGSCS